MNTHLNVIQVKKKQKRDTIYVLMLHMNGVNMNKQLSNVFLSIFFFSQCKLKIIESNGRNTGCYLEKRWNNRFELMDKNETKKKIIHKYITIMCYFIFRFFLPI